MVSIISRSQRRKIQQRYTQYQRDLKESGESTSMAQAKDQTDEGLGSKPALKIKRSASMEQLAKVHAELRANEKFSLAGLEKALMESDDETDEGTELGQERTLVQDGMLEAFMAEQTFLVDKQTEVDHQQVASKESASTEVLKCSMEDAS